MGENCLEKVFQITFISTFVAFTYFSKPNIDCIAEKQLSWASYSILDGMTIVNRGASTNSVISNIPILER